MDEPRARVQELVSLLQVEFGAGLLGLYLFGSLPAGQFVAGRSDLDLLAVIEEDVNDERLASLGRLHSGFVERHPEWIERVEVGYVGREVLQTLPATPAGTIAVISPGEPLHIKDAKWDWTLNWYSVCTKGEVLFGLSPLDLGPDVSVAAYKRAVASELTAWQQEARAPRVAYVPALQGYIVVTICRALYGLATGEQTTKENAAAWAAEQFPDWGRFVDEALALHRADVSEAHRAVIRFVDDALTEAERFQS